MQLAFSPDKQVEVSFKIGVAGTSSAPKTVMVVLERGNLALSFNAIKEGDEYKAVVQDVSVFSEGEVALSVNVLLNGRLFTPFKSTALIKTPESIASTEQIELTIENVSTANDTVIKNAITEISKPAPVAAPAKPIIDEKAISEMVKQVSEQVKIGSPIKMSLLKSVEPEKKVTKVTAPVRESVTRVTDKQSTFKLKKVSTFVK